MTFRTHVDNPSSFGPLGVKLFNDAVLMSIYILRFDKKNQQQLISTSYCKYPLPYIKLGMSLYSFQKIVVFGYTTVILFEANADMTCKDKTKRLFDVPDTSWLPRFFVCFFFFFLGGNGFLCLVNVI